MMWISSSMICLAPQNNYGFQRLQATRRSGSGSGSVQARSARVLCESAPGSSDIVSDEARTTGVLRSASNVAVVSLAQSPTHFLSVTGRKPAKDGERKVVTMKICARFIPKDIWRDEEARKVLIKNSGRTTPDYEPINYDLTTLNSAELPSIDFSYHCHGKSPSKGDHSPHDGFVNVQINEVFNGLLAVNNNNNQQEYIDYHINCQFSGDLIGVVMFSELKKPPTWWKRALSWMWQNLPNCLMPCCGTTSTITVGVVGMTAT